MREEIWKDIPDFEGLYQASNFGRVRSLNIEKKYNPVERRPYTKLLKGKILKPYCNNRGFLTVSLYKNGTQFRRCVHTLVATTFLENPNKYNFIGFKDGNKLNTDVSNLKRISHTGGRNRRNGYV